MAVTHTNLEAPRVADGSPGVPWRSGRVQLHREDGLGKVSGPEVQLPDPFLDGERTEDEPGSLAVLLEGTQQGLRRSGSLGTGQPSEVDTASAGTVAIEDIV